MRLGPLSAHAPLPIPILVQTRRGIRGSYQIIFSYRAQSKTATSVDDALLPLSSIYGKAEPIPFRRIQQPALLLDHPVFYPSLLCFILGHPSTSLSTYSTPEPSDVKLLQEQKEAMDRTMEHSADYYRRMEIDLDVLTLTQRVYASSSEDLLTWIKDLWLQ